jgi:hypothetical protein
MRMSQSRQLWRDVTALLQVQLKEPLLLVLGRFSRVRLEIFLDFWSLAQRSARDKGNGAVGDTRLDSENVVERGNSEEGK